MSWTLGLALPPSICLVLFRKRWHNCGTSPCLRGKSTLTWRSSIAKCSFANGDQKVFAKDLPYVGRNPPSLLQCLPLGIPGNACWNFDWVDAKIFLSLDAGRWWVQWGQNGAFHMAGGTSKAGGFISGKILLNWMICPQSSSIYRWDLPWTKPSSYWGTPHLWKAPYAERISSWK